MLLAAGWRILPWAPDSTKRAGTSNDKQAPCSSDSLGIMLSIDPRICIPHRHWYLLAASNGAWCRDTHGPESSGLLSPWDLDFRLGT